MIVNTLLLSLTLFVHELGHLLAAMVCHVRVSKFCIFFDPWFRLVDTGARFSTRFCVGWIPLGAYVLFDSLDDKTTASGTYINTITPFKRLVIYLSGVLMNISVAFLCFFMWVSLYADKHHQYNVQYHVRITQYVIGKETARAFSYMTYSAENVRHLSPTEQKNMAKKVIKDEKTTDKWYGVLWKFACSNIFIALFNILPIPPLDGVRGLYVIYESIIGKPVSSMFQIVAGAIGFIVILGMNVLDLFRQIFGLS